MQTWFVLIMNGAFLSVLMNADVSKIVWNVCWRQTACCSRYKSFLSCAISYATSSVVAATTDGAPAPYKGCISGRTRSLSSRLRFGMEHWCAELTTPLASRPELRMSRTSGVEKILRHMSYRPWLLANKSAHPPSPETCRSGGRTPCHHGQSKQPNERNR